MAKRYILSSEIQRVKAKHPPLELLLDAVPEDGASPAIDKKVIVVPAMQTWPDDVLLYANTQPVRGARLLLGENYDHYSRAGGTANVLFQIMQDYSQADLGESSASDAS